MTHSRKKILVVTSTFPASDSDPVPAFVRDQVIAMNKTAPNLEFSVLAPHDKRSNTSTLSKHLHYTEYRFHYAFPHSLEKLAGRGIMPALQANPLNYLLILPLFIGELFATWRLTRQIKPDVLYAHWFTPQAIICALVSRYTGIPFIFTTHASDVAVWKKIPIIGKFIVRLVTHQASKITAVSERSMQKLEAFFTNEEWGKQQAKAKIIPMGISVTPITPRTAQNKKILFIGRLVEKKGVQYLLPAFKTVLRDHPDAKLVVAGDGPWRQKLEALAKELNILKNIEFVGYIHGEKKAELLSSASYYVVPSIITDSGDAEGLPVSLMEGLANGLVCIATNESGADNIITHGEDGYLIPQKDSDTLANTLLLALSLDKTTYQNLSERALQTSKQFEWPAVAAKHIDFFEFA